MHDQLLYSDVYSPRHSAGHREHRTAVTAVGQYQVCSGNYFSEQPEVSGRDQLEQTIKHE